MYHAAAPACDTGLERPRPKARPKLAWRASCMEDARNPPFRAVVSETLPPPESSPQAASSCGVAPWRYTYPTFVRRTVMPLTKDVVKFGTFVVTSQVRRFSHAIGRTYTTCDINNKSTHARAKPLPRSSTYRACLSQSSTSSRCCRAMC